MSDLKVSVIMPVYNGALFLETSIPSVLSQTFADFELLVIDDASKDHSFELLTRWAELDARVRVLRNEHNLGIFGTLNRLVELSRGSLLKIFCQDDLMMTNCLERQASYMDAHPMLGFSRCLGAQESPGKGAQKGPYRYQTGLPEIIFPASAVLAFFTFGNIPGNLTNVICRKDALLVSGPFDQSLPFAGDFEMWVRVACRFPFGLQSEALVRVHSHKMQGSVTLNRHNELIAQLDVVMGSLYDKVPLQTRNICRLHASVTTMNTMCAMTLRRLLEAKWKAVKPFLAHRRYAYPWPFCVIIYIATLGERWGYHATSKRLLQWIDKLNKPSQ